MEGLRQSREADLLTDALALLMHQTAQFAHDFVHIEHVRLDLPDPRLPVQNHILLELQTGLQLLLSLDQFFAVRRAHSVHSRGRFLILLLRVHGLQEDLLHFRRDLLLARRVLLHDGPEVRCELLYLQLLLLVPAPDHSRQSLQILARRLNLYIGLCLDVMHLVAGRLRVTVRPDYLERSLQLLPTAFHGIDVVSDVFAKRHELGRAES